MPTTYDTSRIATHFRFSKTRLQETRDLFLAQGGQRQLDCYDTEGKGHLAVIYPDGSIDLRSRFYFQGKRLSIRHGTLSPLFTVEQARLANAAARLQISQGIEPRIARRKGMLFRELFLEHFVPHNYDKRSLKDDVQKYDLRLEARFGEIAINSIQPFDLTSFLRELRDRHGLSPATINRYQALLKAVFRFGLENDFIAKSPAQYLKPLLETNVRSRTLSEEERGRFVSACNTEAGPAGRLLLLLVISGARLGEALGARVEDINLPGKTWFLPMTKAGKADQIFLGTAAVSLLPEIIGDRRSGYLFPGKQASKPMTRPAKAFARICAQAGLENFRIHDLRRTWATIAINNGVPLHTVATALRHASPHITAKRYAFLQDKALIDAHEVVGQLVCNGPVQACT